jgi:phosphoglycerate dehydrogenase-like enzyme
VSGRPVVVIAGTRDEGPPPGIDRATEYVELRRADDMPSLLAAVAEADGVLLWGGEREWLQEAWPRAERLRWIHSPSDGVEWLLFPELIESDVEVTNARGVFDDAIAEWVIGAMLAFVTRILDQRDAQARREWMTGTTERLAGTRLLVVGPGPIGRAVARRAVALGMEVSAAGRTSRHDEVLGSIVATSDDMALTAALGAADFVLDAMPLTPSTRGFFHAGRFHAMRSSARFINVGRGATVDQPALIEALRGGTIGGAALDVFEVEPVPPDSPLWTMPNVLLSPHMSGDFDGWEKVTVAVFVDNAARFSRGEPLRNPVDKHAGHGVDEPAKLPDDPQPT